MANALTRSRVTLSEAAIHLTRNVALKISEIFRLEDNDEISLFLLFFFFFSRILKKGRHLRKASLYFFSPELLAKLFILKEVKPSPEHK